MKNDLMCFSPLKKPWSSGQGQMQRLGICTTHLLLNDRVVATTNNHAVTNESVSKILTNDLALPVPYNPDA